MLDEVKNLLYRQPELYELVYPEPNEETPEMCRRMFTRFLGRFPASALDIGCGTGRDLATIARDCNDCVGTDALPAMIALARSRYPQIRWDVADMRQLRLNRAFDAILCMGSVFMYALTNDDVAKTLDTFAAHSRPGTLLILDINNAASMLPGGSFEETTELTVDTPNFKAIARVTNSFDRRRQLLVRRRIWEVPEGPVDDYCHYRLFFPAELEHLLAVKGFQVAGMFDNMQLETTDLSQKRLYVAALFREKE